MKTPRISIVIPNYNYGRFLPRLARCLYSQTLGMDLAEIILVDDGSTDDSLDRTMDLEGLQPLRFEMITLEHCGLPGQVRNAGLAKASGDFLVCLDPDDLPAPDLLAACIAQLEDHTWAGLAYSDYNHVENGGYREVILPDYDENLLRQQNILPPSAVMRRQAWEQGEGFRTNTAYEDWDFWVQMASKGVTGTRVPHTLYAHIVHGDNFSLKARQQDGPAKAAIVLNNPSFFPASVRHWAASLMEGQPWAIPFPRGIIPSHLGVTKLMERTGAAG